MKTLRNSLLVAGGFAILVGALVLSGLQPQEVEAKKVKTVNAQQSGAWNVQVGNTTANPVPVVVQNGDANGTVELVEFFELDVPSGTRIDFAPIGTDERLVITDVIVSDSDGGRAQNARILRDGVVVSSFNVPDVTNGTYEHSYVSGILFREGETPGIIGAVTGRTTNWELRGFLETLPSP